MKAIGYFGLMVLFTLFLNSCKKGENDPAISLRTRKARLTGEWELKSMTYTETGDNYSTGSYSEGVRTESQEVAGSTVTYSYPYKLIVNIEKDGSYSMVETNNGEISTYEGIWAFSCGSKDADLKKKEAVIFSLTKLTYSDGTYEEYNDESRPQEVWILDELSNKKIVSNYLNNGTQTTFLSGTSVGSSVQNVTSTMTFEKN